MKSTATRKKRRPDPEHRPERDRLDASHDSDARGEHRYADVHQTAAEQKARRDRDDLKRSLASHHPLSRRRRR